MMMKPFSSLVLFLFLSFFLHLPLPARSEQASSKLPPATSHISSTIAINLDEGLITIKNLSLESTRGVINIQGQIRDLLSHPAADLQIDIQGIQWKDLRVDNLQARLGWQDLTLNIKELSGTIFRGKVEGKGSLSFQDKPPHYELSFSFQDLHMEEISQIINPEKIEMEGRLGGKLRIGGWERNLNVFTGEFTTAPPGGRIKVKQMPDILDKLPLELDKQSVTLLLESLKDYHYTEGKITLSLEEDQKIKSHLFFQGEQGTRDIDLYLHDFSKP